MIEPNGDFDMKTMTIWIDQCVPGMTTAETITNSLSAVVVNSGTVLDEYIIEKLKNLQMQKIRVFIQNDREIRHNSHETVKKEYRQNIDNMRDVMHDITIGKKMDMLTINEVSSSMLSRSDDITGILACLNQIRTADEYTYSHCLNVSFICMMISRWISFSGCSDIDVLEAGLLHDVGKCRISLDILNKPSSLTDEEFGEMKKHPIYGYRILSGSPDIQRGAALAALNHHERNNGKGYPFGLKADKIHALGKICSIADIYDAMTSNRVYHRKASPFQVFRMLEEQTFNGLEPGMVMTFIMNLAGYYIGDRVMLSNGERGEVAFINPRAISRPVINAGGEVIDLNTPEFSDVIVDEILAAP
jgi:HD-GYP domain-containing protein (c-di-GMP phosphodiesterase class II)